MTLNKTLTDRLRHRHIRLRQRHIHAHTHAHRISLSLSIYISLFDSHTLTYTYTNKAGGPAVSCSGRCLKLQTPPDTLFSVRRSLRAAQLRLSGPAAAATQTFGGGWGGWHRTEGLLGGIKNCSLNVAKSKKPPPPPPAPMLCEYFWRMTPQPEKKKEIPRGRLCSYCKRQACRFSGCFAYGSSVCS